MDELRQLYQHFPNKWEELRELDDKSPGQYKTSYSVRQLEAKFKAEGLIQDAYDFCQ